MSSVVTDVTDCLNCGLLGRDLARAVRVVQRDRVSLRLRRIVVRSAVRALSVQLAYLFVLVLTLAAFFTLAIRG